MKKYRLVEGIGNHWNKRWEVQERYTYYDVNGKKIDSWHTVYHSKDKQSAENVLKNYIYNPLVNKNIISIEEAMEIFA